MNESATKVNTEITKGKAEVEKVLTKKVKIQRRDLVYKYCKLDETKNTDGLISSVLVLQFPFVSIIISSLFLHYHPYMEEVVETRERLSKEFLMAKNNSAENNEESKSIG